jgi:predicted anti-sigma-YlaC factor YlaD
MARAPRQAGGRQATVNAGRLWAGGLAAAVIAALIAVVGILIARGIFDVAVLAPEGDGTWGDADTGRYALAAAVAALVATGLIHLLILFVPRYATFFGWIMVLATAVAVLAPFALDVETSAKVATALINLVLGVAIGSLIAGVARTAIQLPRSDTWSDVPPPYQR